MLRGVGQRPVLAVLVGAVAIAFSGILFRLSHVSASTGAFYRCVFALPPLWLLARLETRRFGRLGRRAVVLAWLAGAFFAVDLILWHNGIEQVGAGLATVLGNTQVVMVGLLAWAILGERPHRSSLTAIPIVGVGVLLISGVLESGAYGKNPGLGVVYGVTTAMAYSGFLLALREGSRDLRRPAGPLFTNVRVRARLCGDRCRRRRPRLDALMGGDGLARGARAVLAGARLAADLDVAPTAAGRDDVHPADVPARLRRRLRGVDRQRIALVAPARRRSLHPRRARHGDCSSA